MNRDQCPANSETRDTVSALEIRAAAEAGKSPGTLVGYAAVFDRYSLDLGYFREKIQRGAFAKALARCDVRAVVNHDPAAVIGRMSAKTLRLEEDELGLRVEIDLPDTSTGRDAAVNVGLGNIQGQSFMFTTAIDTWDWSGEVPVRTVVEVDELYEVGPVTFPAYEETSVALRSWKEAVRRLEIPPPPEPPAPPDGPAPQIVEAARNRDRLRLLELEVI